jgi:cholesterol oxidase
VAALRFSEAGERVVVLERGAWIKRDTFEPDLDFFWRPDRNAFGMHDFQFPGKRIFAWLGCGVGGGSNTFAATMKRCDDFSAYPAGITVDEMTRYYQRAEDMMCVTPYPDYPPYSNVRATRLLLRAEQTLREEYPALVVEQGPLPLAISFAPPGERPGAEFTNKHGVTQRYSDPRDQSILGGDIGSKNSLDHNYLALAQRHGAEVRALHEVTHIERTGDHYRVRYRVRKPETGRIRRWRRRWLPWLGRHNWTTGHITARRLVISAGALGSTRLLLQHRAELGLGPSLGTRYSTNGDYITLMIPFRALFLCWFAVSGAIAGLALHAWWLVGASAAAYYAGLLVSDRAYDPDIGVTNSDHIEFRGAAPEPGYVLIEGGRYPTLGKWSLAILMSVFGVYHPERYRWISRGVNFLRRWIPPFGAFARTWPLPLLTMGRDGAYGSMRLERGKLWIDFDPVHNAEFYAFCDRVGRLVARASRSWWLPNILFAATRRLQVPHNLGGVPMSDDPATGIVDSCGRVFGHPNLMVLDGSIIPAATGPNPALTILAVSERAMEHVIAQLRSEGTVRASG